MEDILDKYGKALKEKSRDSLDLEWGTLQDSDDEKGGGTGQFIIQIKLLLWILKKKKMVSI